MMVILGWVVIFCGAISVFFVVAGLISIVFIPGQLKRKAKENAIELIRAGFISNLKGAQGLIDRLSSYKGDEEAARLAIKLSELKQKVAYK